MCVLCGCVCDVLLLSIPTLNPFCKPSGAIFVLWNRIVEGLNLSSLLFHKLSILTFSMNCNSRGKSEKLRMLDCLAFTFFKVDKKSASMCWTLCQELCKTFLI